MAEALRHLGIAAHGTGRLEVARQRLNEPYRLRHEIGLLPGAAANMVGLAYIAAAQERSDDALALLDEASAIAEASQAHRILQQVNEARAELSDQHTHRPACRRCRSQRVISALDVEAGMKRLGDGTLGGWHGWPRW